MKVVVALGGTALARRGEALDAEVQRRNIAHAIGAVAGIARTHSVIITHGNSQQVGLLAMQSVSYGGPKPYPLDMLGAESEGMIGYLVEQELRNLLPGKHVVTVLTQVEVNRNDAAFHHPSKIFGPALDQLEAERVSRGMSLEEAGEACGIHPYHLEAIEYGDMTCLPERHEALAMIGAYSQFLGFDPEPLVEHFAHYML